MKNKRFLSNVNMAWILDKVKELHFWWDYAIAFMFGLEVLIFLDMHIEVLINKSILSWICF